MFDRDGAAWADRHRDFRYLVLGPEGEDELDGALEVHHDEPATGVRTDRDRVRLCSAACAIGYLASWRGVPPEARCPASASASAHR